MPVTGVGGPQAPQQLTNTQPTGGEIETSLGSKIGKFFSSIGDAIKSAFVSFGNAVSGLFAKGADASAAKSSPGLYTSAEKRQMLADFRQSAMYQAVNGGDALTKGNLENGAERILKSPTALQAMKANGLSLTEAVAIYVYTTGDYSSINAQLRNDAVSGDVRAVIDQCVAGMAKLPSHDETVSRLVNLPTGAADAHAKGATVSYEGFTSTSTKPNGDITFGGNMFMLIEPKNGSTGKDVSMFSNLPDEQEVLFPPGTQFKIIERTEPVPQSERGFVTNDQPHLGKINLIMQEI